MEFRLIYQGALPSASRDNPRAAEKHLIRKYLHKQLQQYWLVHPFLSRFVVPGALENPQAPIARITKEFMRGPHKFIPLVRQADDSYCAISILFLRREDPGRVVNSGGGDLDNRLKTLMDALQVPRTTKGLPDAPEPDYDPTYCLLEDDGLVTTLKITTDRILTPPDPTRKDKNDVTLIIHVHVYRGTNVTHVLGLPGSA